MRVSDYDGQQATQQFTLTIDPMPPLLLSGAGPCCNAGTVGTAYPAIAFGATGGETPYTFSVAAGQVPPGLSFSSGNPGTYNNNVLSGTPTNFGKPCLVRRGWGSFAAKGLLLFIRLFR